MSKAAYFIKKYAGKGSKQEQAWAERSGQTHVRRMTAEERERYGVTSKSKSPLGIADALFSKRIRERAEGRCWAQGKTSFDCGGYLQCCHVVSRRYGATRWDDDNAVAMCAAHHVFYTHRPLEWQEVMGERFFEMKQKALHGTPERAQDAAKRLSTL